MELLPQLLSAGLVLGLLAGCVWWLRAGRRPGGLLVLPRRGGGARSRRLETLERLALSPQPSLQLVRLDDREYLLALAGGGVKLLNVAARRPAVGAAGRGH